MEVSIKKVGEQDGIERFILVNAQTRRVISASEVNETAIRRFFEQLGADGELIDQCIRRARERYDEQGGSDARLSDPDEEDLLFELGLDNLDDES